MIIRGRPNLGYSFGYGVKTASKMTLSLVSANMLSAKFALRPLVEPGFGMPPLVNSPTVWAVTEAAQAV